MQIQRLLRRLSLALAPLLASAGAAAIGLGAGPGAVTLGQALDFAVPVRLEADETLNADCVQAEVLLGEQRVSPGAVRTRVTGSGSAATLRISTSMVIDEPIVTVQITAGCAAKVSRRYVVFADPGTNLVPPAVLAQAEAVAERAGASERSTAADSSAAAATPALAGAVATPQAAEVGASARAKPQRASRNDARAERRVARANPATPAKAARPRAVASAKPRAVARAAAPSPKATIAPPPASLNAAAPAVGPRLVLDAADAVPPTSPAVIEQAFEAVAQAASAAQAAAAAASASAERIAQLERSVALAQAQARSSQGELERLRLELAESGASNPWLWPLLGLVCLATLAAAWFAWRVRAMRRVQEVAWQRASSFVVPAPEVAQRETAPLPLITSALTVPPSRAGVGPSASGATEMAPLEPSLEPAMARTVVLPPSVRMETRPDEGAPRDVSIEELIDVDQQAEFFIALGQDTAAIDLLVAHLRNTGGGSPLTYLKLLEIYRRRGDQAAYDRTRSRFNQRYNAYAPEWGADLTQGQALEDYPGVIPRLEQAWANPLDAMAELEALLFRKSRGELFELPAYRDVLFLYSLARDLLEREPADHSHVDLLLPLDGKASDAVQVGSARAVSAMAFDEHPTAPVDLDLTPVRAHESIFGDLPQPKTPSRKG